MSFYYVTFLKEVAEKVYGDNLPKREDGTHPAESTVEPGGDYVCPDFEAEVLKQLDEVLEEKSDLEDRLQQISSLAAY